jgi:histidinol dehydrogenase
MARTAHDVTETNGDWAAQAADTIEGVVTSIRNKTTVPLTTVVRAVVFGLLAAFAGGTAMVLLAIGMVRGVDVITGSGNVWIAHLAIGMVFVLVGVLLWRKRSPKER